MKLFKKIGTAALAASLMASTAIVAQAEETELKLLTADNNIVSTFGSNYFSNTSGEIIKIGEEEIAKWSKTGTLTPTVVKSDIDLSDKLWFYGNLADGDYLQFSKQDSEGNVQERYLLHLDRTNNEITTAQTFGSSWCSTTQDGYTFSIVSIDVSTGEITYSVTSPTGEVKTNSLKSIVAHMDGAKWDDYVWSYAYGVENNDKYVGYILTDENYERNMFDYENDGCYCIYGIQRNGEAHAIIRNWEAITCGGFYYVDGEYLVIAFLGETNSGTAYYNASISESNGYSYVLTLFSDDLTYIDSSREIMIVEGSNETKYYYLMDIINGTTVAKYSYISKGWTNNTDSVKEEIFQAKNDNGEWLYIDRSGSVLGTFDSASAFSGDYAIVVKDGKAYLIDKDMNCVSEKIDGAMVGAFRDGFFVVQKEDGTQVIVTYARPETASESTSEPTSEPASEPTSEPASEPTSEPASDSSSESVSEPAATPSDTSNPSTGIVYGLAVVAAAASVCIVSRKKR